MCSQLVSTGQAAEVGNARIPSPVSQELLGARALPLSHSCLTKVTNTMLSHLLGHEGGQIL